MQANGRDVKLVFAGDGPYRAQLQEKCPDAIFLGMCSQQQLAPVYASADVFVFPSLTETFGNVTLEALASGTPVIAFDCAAAGALIEHQVNGWLVAMEDESTFIRTALQAVQDVSALRDMRRSTAASVQNLAWSSIADAAEQVFRRVLLQAS
jgi:glycosyltransferase involved in cell wall biosynthesis